MTSRPGAHTLMKGLQNEFNHASAFLVSGIKEPDYLFTKNQGIAGSLAIFCFKTTWLLNPVVDRVIAHAKKTCYLCLAVPTVKRYIG